MSGRLETFLVRPTDGAPEDARREPALPMPKRRAWGREGSVEVLDAPGEGAQRELGGLPRLATHPANAPARSASASA